MGQIGKIIGIILIIVIIINLFPKNTDDDIRVRVIASSDDEEDQAEKYVVVDALLKMIDENGYLNKLQNKDIQNKIKKEISSKVDPNHTVEIEYEKLSYPSKTIDGKLVPSGKYWTIVVRLGSAEGKNWWSIMYPEYFGLSFKDRVAFEEIEYRSYVYDKWIKREE